MVETVGFEPTTSCAQGRRPTRMDFVSVEPVLGVEPRFSRYGGDVLPLYETGGGPHASSAQRGLPPPGSVTKRGDHKGPLLTYRSLVVGCHHA